MRMVNERGLDLIKDFEGYRSRAYQCPAGVWTVGYGHTRTARKGLELTETEAESLLNADLEEAENAVESLTRVPLSDNQFSALVSFVFNVGGRAFQDSTLLSRLNAGDYDAVPVQLKRWNRAGGQVLNGLVRRREAEATLWSTPDE